MSIAVYVGMGNVNLDAIIKEEVMNGEKKWARIGDFD